MAEKCANPTCKNQGKSKCSACALVSYCGPDCQKSHWNEHKTLCKANRKKNSSSPTPPAAIEKRETSPGIPNNIPLGKLPLHQQPPSMQIQIPIDPQLAAKLTQLKNQTQQAFQSGGFDASIKLGLEALVVCEELPEPVKSIESIQVLMNLSTACLQMGQFDNALAHSEKCVEVATQGVEIREYHPQAQDMLAAAIVTKAFVLLNQAKYDDAEKNALRALEISQGIFPPNDPRFFKVLRCLGLTYARKENLGQAERYLREAYDCVSSGPNGPLNNDSQQSGDELIQIMSKRGKGPEVEKFIKSCYFAIEEHCTDPFHLLLGEAAAKYASVLMNQQNPKEALRLLEKCLKIREKSFGPMSIQVAMTLIGLGNIREAGGDVSEATEALLGRALKILKEGPTNISPADEQQVSTHVLNCISFMRRVRSKREGGVAADDVSQPSSVAAPTTTTTTTPSTPSNNAAAANKEESKPVKNGSATKGPREVKPVTVTPPEGPSPESTPVAAHTPPPSSSLSAISLSAAKSKSRVEEEFVSPTKSLDPDDGVTRMKMAGYFFETGQFSKAEYVIQEAFQIFLRVNGPQHPSTITARQNLELVKQNALQQLWNEVIFEEKERMTIKAMSELSLSDNNNNSSSSSIQVASGAASPIALEKKSSSFSSSKSDDDNTSWSELSPNVWKAEEKPASSCSIS